MHNELTNLLPYERQRALVREYFLRLGVVIVVLLTIIMFVAAVLLLPTYVLLSASSSAKEIRLASMKATLSAADEAALSTHLAALSNNMSILTAIAGTPSVSAIIRTMLAVSRPGVTLSSFGYKAATPKSPGTIVIMGTSATRDALRNYQLALEGIPSIRSANLPISAYAKDTDIAFTVTVTLAP